MEKVKIDVQPKAYRLLNPGCVVIISVGDGKEDNLFSVTWNMPVRQEPGMVAILSGKRHYSYPFISRTGEFGVNVPDAGLVDAVFGCGSVTGHDGVDKFERFSLTRQEPAKIKAPLVKEAIANLECRVCQVVDMGPSSLLISQILAAWVNPDHFQKGEWNFDNGLRLLHHLGGKRFTFSDQVINAN